ncbi:hypothetical protein VFPPC_16616 [Pochonia chlamydosporia 170]|uniref:Uncharacterized protein n=1 Tax=Pochonia chlamydosporia 170 TaxID=1380566 RepID=A0A179F9K6_METCM|nr:hypothetical protein VFPPC_16616 [Pochonia chlamydosporia 170]OAQ62132.1 hypothetical protein VFPPC_16616 [Pochonia chlamydosporia 170]
MTKLHENQVVRVVAFVSTAFVQKQNFPDAKTRKTNTCRIAKHHHRLLKQKGVTSPSTKYYDSRTSAHRVAFFAVAVTFVLHGSSFPQVSAFRPPVKDSPKGGKGVPETAARSLNWKRYRS